MSDDRLIEMLEQTKKNKKEVNLKKLLESNQIAISQLSYDLGDLRKRLDLLEDKLDDLFKK
jgi:predicted  nucleic acid-binding Zn-ribbon protein